ncbi:MAG: Mth938-like domain-containing protein [Pseudorhodoplanes sp.]|nr:Mth938-like domain-containing protein [Pseudorhodoplanes sp.]
MSASAQQPHFPRPAEIEAYGRGGFRFAGMSHRGSLLCLPSGIWGWPVIEPAQIDEASLSRVFADAAGIGFFILGTGQARVPLADALLWRFRDLRINVETMTTGQAANTYNILLGEGRQVAAGLIAVD